MVNRAEELITQLEAEIVKRDARIVELEAERNRLLNNPKDVFKKMCDMALKQRDEFAAELSELKARPSGVVLPEPLRRGDEGGSGEYGAAMIRGFNACLREVARLNSYPVSAGEYEAVEVIGYRVSMPGEPELGTWLDEEAEDEPQIQRHEPIMTVAQHEKIVASLKPCANGITAQDERAMFDVYICAEQGWPGGIDTTHIGATFAPWRAWKARARLNHNPTDSRVVLPERAVKDGGKFSTWLKVTGWNACLDEVARLNPCRAQAVQVNHDSDCSTNNHGVPELLGPCDCSASKDK